MELQLSKEESGRLRRWRKQKQICTKKLKKSEKDLDVDGVGDLS